MRSIHCLRSCRAVWYKSPPTENLQSQASVTNDEAGNFPIPSRVSALKWLVAGTSSGAAADIGTERYGNNPRTTERLSAHAPTDICTKNVSALESETTNNHGIQASRTKLPTTYHGIPLDQLPPALTQLSSNQTQITLRAYMLARIQNCKACEKVSIKMGKIIPTPWAS